MSHYTTIKTELTNPETLEEAIRCVGFEVETGKDLNLYDYAGVRRGKADLVIRRKHLDKLSNDIGFRKVGNKYKVVISDYDEVHVNKGNFLRELTQKYSYLTVQREIAHQGLKLIREETRAGGTIEIVVTT